MAGERLRDLVDGPARAVIQGPYSVAAVPRPHIPFGSLPNAQLILLSPFALCVYMGWKPEPGQGREGGSILLWPSDCLDQTGLVSISGR